MAPFFKPGTLLYDRFYTDSPPSVGSTDSDISGPIVDPMAFLNPVAGFTSSGQLPQGPSIPVDGGWGPIVGAVAERLLGQNPDFGDVVAGSSTALSQDIGGLSCWRPTRSGKLSRRANVRIVRGPDGLPRLEKYCRPKRMNPLNARALGRAARRLGSFHRIAGAIEKQIAKSCNVKSRRRAPSSRSYGCRPKC